MHLPKYQYKSNDSFLDYEFVSNGPKGNIRKIVRFSRLSSKVYNLAFGDLDEETGELNDRIVSNNKDSMIVLATIADIVNSFLSHFPERYVAVRGSTHSRTRLYRINIVIFWVEISSSFQVYGLKNRVWEPFEKDKNYDAFLIHKK
jgi:hypothetical protein